MARFELAVERLTEVRESHDFEASAAWWADRERALEEGELCEVEAPFRFALEVARVREQILLEGDLDGRIALECSRCARRYSHALREPFRLLLSPLKDREPADPEGAKGLADNGLYLGEELEEGWFKGPRIRLDDFFGEVIALAMPLQPLCRDDCPGVCGHCGADLSATRCDCEDEKVESPFAVLAGLTGKTD